MLLIQGPHFENHKYRDLAFGGKGLIFAQRRVCGLGKQCRDLKERNQFTLKFFSVRKRHQSSMDEYDCGGEDGLKALLTFAIPDVLGTQT